MDIDVSKIIDFANSIPGGLTAAGFLAWLLPRIIKKELAAKWARSAIRALFSRINMGGQGWRATVLYIAANMVDEADKIFDANRKSKQDTIIKEPGKITVTVYGIDESVLSKKVFVAHDKPEICAAAYRTDYYEAVSAGADDIQRGEAARMEVK